ncbi:hypothetical protein HL10_gp153 [Cronobacter phage CR8]|uniref:Uncharacterized protein n=1 Tax=Cronobacter phage CR8 TaxID=1327934 RepID=A0A060AMH0_9CAUD|nr:hypothetical protein HL10_gp153 [Cronobacter phage CR8]AIA64683.1 hypothetical protein CR8_153 [Cronobacter phage CR8]
MNLTDLKYYDELTPAAQAQARRNAIASEAIHRKKHIEEARQRFKADPNKAINDPYHIRKLYNGGAAGRKIRQEGDAYTIRFIRSNRMIFTECGAYVYYVTAFGMIKEGREYIPTAEQQKELRTPYIDVNGRGPAFHDWLYRMHHKIKFFMIRG